MLNFKKTALAAVICSTAFTSTVAFSVTYDVLGFTYVMQGVTPDNIAPPAFKGVGSWQEGAAAFNGSAFGQTATCLGCGTIDSSAGFTGLEERPFKGAPVTTYFAPTGIDGVIHAGPTIDLVGGTADMSSFYVNWNGTEFNQGAIADVADNVDGSLTLSWNSLIVGGGAFSGTMSFWTMTVQASPIPVPAAIWLFGSGLVGLAGIARRRKKP